jgi:DNA topoisomerase 2-associated protein PAT1
MSSHCRTPTQYIDSFSLDFEETYDGLGDQLDETDDAFNDDTFGGMPSTRQGVGTDFDFAGKTSQISNTIHEEQMIYQAQQRPVAQKPVVQQAAKPARTGYEAYKDPNFIPQLEVRNDIWGLKPKESAPARQPEPENRAPQMQQKKILSIEEVEARMRENQNQGWSAPPPAQPSYTEAPLPTQYHQQMHHGQAPYPGMQAPFMPQILQRPQQQPPQQQQQQQQLQQQVPQQPPQQYPQGARQTPQPRAELHGHAVNTPPPQQQHPTVLQRQRPVSNDLQQRQGPPQQQIQRPPSQPRQILQNPNRLSGHGQPMTQTGPRGPTPGHNRGPSFPGMVITHPEQLLHLSETERATFLEEDAKRAKRNHKIALLARDNGLMTPQDKNFITRIQLQQLMTATGNLEDL